MPGLLTIAVIGGGVALASRLFRRSSSSSSTSAAATSGSLTYPDGSRGEWRVAALGPAGWLGQFRIGSGSWLDVPQGIAPSFEVARNLAREQLAFHDPTNPQPVVAQELVAAGWYARVVRTLAGLYQGEASQSPTTPSSWKAVGAPALQPKSARALALEYISNQISY